MLTLDDSKGFLRLFAKITGSVGLYGLAHPATASSVGLLHETVARLLKDGHELTLSALDATVVVNGVPAESAGPVCGIFARHGIHSLVFTVGVERDELTALLGFLSPGEKGADLLWQGSPHIRVNSVHYVKTGEKKEIDAPSGLCADSLEGLNFESMIRMVVDRAVTNEADRKKVFESVIKRFASEVEDKVKEATAVLESEKEEIRQEKEDTERVIRSAAMSAITVDSAGSIVMLDSEAELVIGATLRERSGRPVWDDLKEGQMVTVAVGDAAGVAVKEVMVRGEDETRRVIRASNAVIRDIEGRMVGLFSVLSDMTRYKEIDRLKKDFVANVTHELRTPLVATKQALANILEFPESLDEGHRRMVEIALRNTQRLYRLVNDILDFSKLEAGRLRLSKEMIETGPLLREILASIKPLAESRGVIIGIDAPAALPRLFADRDRITQVMVNLMSNAIKFTKEGGTVAVSTGAVIQTGAETLFEISVRDTGCGIDEKDISRVFEKFEQVEGRKNTGISGTGLGLTITKAIVELHHGTIKVQSVPGAGSTFTFTVPMVPEDAVFIRKAAN